jgi:hypothetical protein
MLLNKATDEWQKGLVKFMKSTSEDTSRVGSAPCPCLKCCCMVYITWSEDQSHLLARGFDANFIQGEGNGNDSDEDSHCNEDATGDGDSIKDLVLLQIRGAIMNMLKFSLNYLKRQRRNCIQDVRTQLRYLSL